MGTAVGWGKGKPPGRVGPPDRGRLGQLVDSRDWMLAAGGRAGACHLLSPSITTRYRCFIQVRTNKLISMIVMWHDVSSRVSNFSVRSTSWLIQITSYSLI